MNFGDGGDVGKPATASFFASVPQQHASSAHLAQK
jgi:hypothetical protein